MQFWFSTPKVPWAFFVYIMRRARVMAPEEGTYRRLAMVLRMREITCDMFTLDRRNVPSSLVGLLTCDPGDVRPQIAKELESTHDVVRLVCACYGVRLRMAIFLL
jgi:hypothetical protein